MTKRTAFTVHVRRTEPVDVDQPELGHNVVQEETFLAGSTLPAWAKALVGDHVYGEDDGSPEPEQDVPEQGDVPEPAGNASLEAWQEYAQAQGVDPGSKSRDELRAHFA